MKSIFLVVLCFCLAGALVAAQSGAGTDDQPSESSAVGSVRTLNTAEVTYAASFKDEGFACTLSQLGEDPSGAKGSTAQFAGFITANLASGHKAGYNFAVNCGAEEQKPFPRVTIYAVPVNPGTGARAFCSELHGTADKIQGGIIYWSRDGKADSCFIKGTSLK
jgi:type IV pilus assembly protein PilA